MMRGMDRRSEELGWVFVVMVGEEDDGSLNMIIEGWSRGTTLYYQ
jgi:hypothetical protein